MQDGAFSEMAKKTSSLLHRKSGWVLAAAIIIAAILFAVSLHRSIQLVKADPFGDLRNRVVGARLVHDGQSPYWHKWQQKDGTRYYDRWNIFPLKTTNITASPFYLHLLEPVANLPQSQLCWYWLGTEYFLFLLVVLLACRLATSSLQQAAIVLLSTLFLFTAAWKHHIVLGQSYIPLLFLLMLAFFIYRSSTRAFQNGLGFGIVAVVFVLIKPIALLFFVPFLINTRKTSRQFIIGAFIPVLLAAGWLLTDKHEQFLWKEYASLLKEHIKLQQKQHPTPAVIEQPPEYAVIENVNMKQVQQDLSAVLGNTYGFQFQTPSIYKNFAGVFHRQIPVPVLNIISLTILTILVAWWFFRHREDPETGMPKQALLGFCLYYIADIFAPLYKGQYSDVQWLFPLAIMPLFYTPRLKYPYLLFLAGFLLNIEVLKIDKLQYAAGEYAMCAALLWMISYSPQQYRSAPAGRPQML